MTPERWKATRALFDRLVELPAPQQDAALAAEPDAALVAEVRLLLAADAQADQFLAAPAVTQPVEPLAAGVRVGPFLIERELGHGGMGTVFLAHRDDPAFTQTVALKVVRRGLDTEHVLARFEAERRILGTLNHPAIARIVDAGSTDDGRPWFAMDSIDGQPLGAYCREHTSNARERVALLGRVCEAVQYAHQRLVVHRDLKPGNILVDREGQPHLLDFGLARVMRDEAVDGAHTATGQQWLTPDYASPEQVRGGPATTATDVHGLGLLLYEALTGAHPFRRATPGQTLLAVTDDAPTPPSLLVALKNGADLDAIVLMSLRKEPERRYQTAEALRDDLQRWLDGLPVRAVRDSRGYRLRRFVARHRGGVAAVGAVFISLVAGLGTTLWQARIAREQSALANSRALAVRRLASTTLFELQDAAREVPGNTKVSALIMQRSTESLELLASEVGDDLSLQRELSEAWTRLAISNSSSSAGGVVGDAAAAEKHLSRAISLSVDVLRQSGDAEGDLVRLVEQQWRLAEVLNTQGKNAEGVAQARVAVATARRLQSPERASRVKLAGALQQLAGQLITTAPAEALALVLEERAVLQALLLQHPGDAHLESSLISLLQREGALRQSLGEPESCALSERALELRKDLAAREQTRSARRALSQTHSSVGNCFHHEKEVQKSLAQFEAALALREVLVDEDPADADAAYLLLSSWTDCLDERPRLGLFAQALDRVDEHHHFGEALLARDPSDLNVAMKLVEFEWDVGLVYKRRAARGDSQLAQQWLQRALNRVKAVDAAGHLAEDDRWMLEELPDDLRDAADAGTR